jgi:hypothetical protein
MLTLQQLKDMKPNTIFAEGIGKDGKDRIRWIAKRGEIYDWTIYYGKLQESNYYISTWGDKLFTEGKIKKFVPCSDGAFSLYRY